LYDRHHFVNDELRLPLIKKNEKITEAHLMAMASLGITSVEVYARPKVVLISTGNELVEPGSIVTPGKIRNSTGVYLTAVLRKLGCDVEYCGIIADETKYFFEKIKEILKNPPDIIISTGAVSMGKYDFITSFLNIGYAQAKKENKSFSDPENIGGFIEDEFRKD
jgi:molybdopterin molybdotransferase